MKRVALALSFVLFLALAAGQPTARAMQDAAFARLLGQLDGAFSSDQLDLIRFAVESTTVRTDQLARMLEQLTFASTQLEAVAIVAGHLEDPENASAIVDTFTFSSDKRAAQELLRRASPGPAPPVGVTTGPHPEPSRDRYARQGILTVRVHDEASVDALVRALRDAPFASDRLAAIETAALATDAFTADQVARVLQTLWFSTDRVDAIHALRYRIVDLDPEALARILAMIDQDAARLEALASLTHTLSSEAAATPVLAVFDFPRNRDEARRLLGRATL